MAIAQQNLETGLCVEERRRAFLAFVDGHRDDAVRLAFRLLGGDTAAAEDVAQEAFLRAYRGLGGFREEASLSTWFYRILIREVHRHRRRQAIRRFWIREVADPPERADERPEGDPTLRRRIAAALERLSASQREVFVLVHLQGLTVNQAAAILGKASGTVKSHLHRALEALRAELADLHLRRPSEPRSGRADGGKDQGPGDDK